MKKMHLRFKALILLMLSMFSLLFDSANAENNIVEKRDTAAVFFESEPTYKLLSERNALYSSKKYSSRFFDLFFGKEKEILLSPSGEAFGISIKEEGTTVCSADSDSGLNVGDRIIKIAGKESPECDDVYEAVKESGGSPLRILVIRDGKETEITTTPKYKNGEYRLGITLRSQSAGIGTVTFIDPETMMFGGLGHSISDLESGAPVSIKSGIATDVLLSGCKKGEAGRAGELSGILKRSVIGSVIQNTDCGVFGFFDNYSKPIPDPIPIAKRSEIRSGEAEIISTVKNSHTAKYKIEITEIDSDSTGSKSFKIKVTDPTLIALTGGIVRGMSGSPIIQNGKLVGAVTHVMVADPTEGYGIFIENMLNASQTDTQKAA